MSKSSRCYVECVGRVRSFLTRNTEIQEHVRRSINCGKRRGNFGTGTDNNQNTFSTVSKTIAKFHFVCFLLEILENLRQLNLENIWNAHTLEMINQFWKNAGVFWNVHGKCEKLSNISEIIKNVKFFQMSESYG